MLPFEFKDQDTQVNDTPFEDDGGDGGSDGHELQEVQPRELHPLQEMVTREEKAPDAGIGNGFGTVTFVEADKEKLREDENHERTSFVASDSSSAPNGGTLALSQKRSSGDV